MPLELIQQQHLSKAVDVFAFGVLLWEVRHATELTCSSRQHPHAPCTHGARTLHGAQRQA
jgi:hypothetical protein